MKMGGLEVQRSLDLQEFENGSIDFECQKSSWTFCGRLFLDV
jgi:hypothetical protein